MSSRRAFLKVGLAGACVLGGVHVADRALFAQAPAAATDGTRLSRLRAEDIALLTALVPAVLEGALPADEGRATAIGEVVAAFDRTIAGLSPAIQREVAELLSLLTFAPSRRLLAGLAAPWSEATTADVGAFLQRWRQHRFALMQQGYQALARVIVACWYGNPRAWAAIDYPGPPYAGALGAE